jgi:hypothetical protein
MNSNIFKKIQQEIASRWRSRYSGWLRAGRPRGRSSSPCRVKNFLFSESSWPALGSTQPPIQWVPGALSPRVKRPGREAEHSPPASAAEVKKMCIYIHSPIRLHGVVLNYLSTGTTLLFYFYSRKYDKRKQYLENEHIRIVSSMITLCICKKNMLVKEFQGHCRHNTKNLHFWI